MTCNVTRCNEFFFDTMIIFLKVSNDLLVQDSMYNGGNTDCSWEIISDRYKVYSLLNGSSGKIFIIMNTKFTKNTKNFFPELQLKSQASDNSGVNLYLEYLCSE